MILDGKLDLWYDKYVGAVLWNRPFASPVQGEVSALWADGGVVARVKIVAKTVRTHVSTVQSPSQKSEIFASPLYTRGPLGRSRASAININ